MMPLYAALDWSGSPDAPEPNVALELYVPCLVCVPVKEELDNVFAAWRKEFGLSLTEELHGHRLRRRPDVLLRVVEYAVMNALVAAVVFDKWLLVRELGAQIFDKAYLLTPATGLLVAEAILQHTPLKMLWYDDGDLVPTRRGAFKTDIQRNARSRWAESPDVRPLPSHKSSHVQLADVIAYVLQREGRGLTETAELRRQVRRLSRKSDCVIRNGNGDDLRPYLP
jgi:hypothetical protein